jgi:hypothetical protein
LVGAVDPRIEDSTFIKVVRGVAILAVAVDVVQQSIVETSGIAVILNPMRDTTRWNPPHVVNTESFN